MSTTDAPATARPAPDRRGPSRVAIVAAAVGALVLVAFALTGQLDRRSLDTAVLGVVEGVTEFLPVSSTGHLTVAQRLLGVGDDPAEQAAADAFVVAVQAGAILAVLALYRQRVGAVLAGIVGRDAAGRRLFGNLLTAFTPFAVVGLLAQDWIKDHLFGPMPVVAGLAVGGVAILVLAPRWTGGARGIDDLAVRAALVIGAAQILAMWPGVSRSLVTILAGLAVGLTASAAVEFSFLLGLVTLGAATSYQMVTEGAVVIDHFGVAAVVIGLGAALVSALLAVRWLVSYLDRHGLVVFGWYRLGAAAVIATFVATGVL